MAPRSPITNPKTSRTRNRPRSRLRMPRGGPIDATIVDCPGFIDFFEETKMALVGVDAARIVIDADPRARCTHNRLSIISKRARCHTVSSSISATRPGADFEGTLAALQALYGRHVAEQLPIFSRSAAAISRVVSTAMSISRI